MSFEYNVDILFNNISYLLKLRGIKLGEFEDLVGVSRGYVSRTRKDEKIKPGLDFVAKAADILNISIDTLLKIDLTGLTPTEEYYLSFIEKLITDTHDSKLEWEVDKIEDFDDAEIFEDHLTFNLLVLKYEDRLAGVSKVFGEDAVLNGDIYTISIKNSQLYLMSYENRKTSVKDVELWIVDEFGYQNNIGTTLDNKRMNSLLNRLYRDITEYLKKPRVSKKVMSVIDAFMTDTYEQN